MKLSCINSSLSSTTTITCPLSRPLATTCPSPVFIVHLLSASATRPSPLACIPSHLFICLHVHVDEGVLLADPRSHFAIAVLLSKLCVIIAIAIVIVGSRSNCSCCYGLPVAFGRKDVIVTKMLIKDVSTLLLLIKLLLRSEANKDNELDCSCN